MMMRRRDEGGIAMILVILVIVILYLVTTQVVYTSRLEDLSARNEALMLQMDIALRRALDQAVQALVDDASQSAGGEGMPGAGGGVPAMGGGEGGGLPGEGGGGEEGEPEAPSDSKNDTWCRPAPFTEGEITVYALVVDENRKFNLLSVLSEDEEFARESRERLARLLDDLREHTDFDISRTDAELMVNHMVEYMRGLDRPEALGRPLQLSDVEGEETRLPKSVEELLALRDIDEFLLYDQVRGDLFLRGLRSVLTVYTSQALPEMEAPENLTHRRSTAGAGGGGSAGRGENPAGGGGEGGQAEPGGGGESAPSQPLGLGIRINVNTAPRSVLRSLLPDVALPRQVWEAVLEYRNEEVEEEEGAREEELTVEEELLGESSGPRTRVFGSVEELDEVEEFKNWGTEEDREKLLNLLTVESDVFTIHLAATVRINEEKGVVFTRRARAVVRRDMEEEEPRIIWICPLVETGGHLVIDYPDFPELERERQEEMEFTGDFADMTARDIYWDPFRFEFYCREKEGLYWQPER